jgi:hypothetical protein
MRRISFHTYDKMLVNVLKKYVSFVDGYMVDMMQREYGCYHEEVCLYESHGCVKLLEVSKSN